MIIDPMTADAARWLAEAQNLRELAAQTRLPEAARAELLRQAEAAERQAAEWLLRPAGRPEAPTTSYATDGKCHNAELGSYGHECGQPAAWLGVTRGGFAAGYCAACRQRGYEARNCVSWTRLGGEAPARG